MTGVGDEQSRLAARSAVLREKVNELLSDFDKRTTQLKQAQQASAALVAELTSADGVVQVRIDASGMLTQLRLSPNTFERTSPEELARTISDLVRRGTTQVRQQAAELMRPLTEDLPDVSDLVPDAPALADMLPKIPTIPEDDPLPDSQPPGSTNDEDAPASWLKDGP